MAGAETGRFSASVTAPVMMSGLSGSVIAVSGWSRSFGQGGPYWLARTVWRLWDGVALAKTARSAKGPISMTETTASLPGIASTASTRWVQLGLGLICMMAISSPQYVWTLFTKPLGSALGVAPASLQVTFSLLIVLQTFFSPFQG